MAAKILLIDDEPAIRSMIKQNLTHAGFTLDEATDGKSGLAMFESGGYAAIVLDLKMPRMNGLEFLRELHHLNPTHPNGPIVVFSSQAEEEVIKAALASGAAKFIPKDSDEFIHLSDTIQSIITPTAS